MFSSEADGVTITEIYTNSEYYIQGEEVSGWENEKGCKGTANEVLINGAGSSDRRHPSA